MQQIHIFSFDFNIPTSSHIIDVNEQKVLIKTGLILAEGERIQERRTILYKSTPGRRCYSTRKRKKIKISVYKYSQEILAHIPPNI